MLARHVPVPSFLSPHPSFPHDQKRTHRQVAVVGAILILVFLAGCAPLQEFSGPKGPVVRVLLAYATHRSSFVLPRPGWAEVEGRRTGVRLSPGAYRLVLENGVALANSFPALKSDLFADVCLHGPLVWPAGRTRSGQFRLEQSDGRVLVRSKGPIVVSAPDVELQNPRGTFPGDVIFAVDGDRIAVINRLPLEVYLRGVVAAEMWRKAPREALRAQAVVARTTALVLLKRSPAFSPYDFCSTERCQVYRGKTAWTAATDEAIWRTRGEVLTLKGRVCEAPYSAVCGGHTEDASLLWSGKRQRHLRGVLDARVRGRLDLKNSATLRRWLEGRPNAFCSPEISAEPAARRYFRWRVKLSGSEIRNRVRETTGVDVGLPVRLEVLQRGVSGRALTVFVTGPRDQVKIRGELAIRKNLRRKPLPSSCFVVIPVADGIELLGAGYGHGVGMCQAGAVGMAGRGYTYREILEHYYPGTRVARKY